MSRPKESLSFAEERAAAASRAKSLIGIAMTCADVSIFETVECVAVDSFNACLKSDLVKRMASALSNNNSVMMCNARKEVLEEYNQAVAEVESE